MDRAAVNPHSAMQKLLLSLLFILTSCGGESADPEPSKPEFADTKTVPNPEAPPPDPKSDGDAERDRRRAEREERGAQWFESQDIDGDGALTQVEMGNLAWVFLHQADLDGDGKITPEEMRAAREQGRFKRPEPTKVIEILDTDGDGLVGPQELPEAVRSRILDADVDGDGKISLLEIEVLNAQQDAARPPDPTPQP